jgi:hypothetical protein
VALPAASGSGWLPVNKVRRRRSFQLVGDRAVERPVSEIESPGCSVELTEFEAAEERWWTLCLEARGEPEMLERELRATADALFAERRPKGVRFTRADSRSYARWLARRSGERASGSVGVTDDDLGSIADLARSARQAAVP